MGDYEKQVLSKRSGWRTSPVVSMPIFRSESVQIPASRGGPPFRRKSFRRLSEETPFYRHPRVWKYL
jgi:hypothetical protein